MKTLRVARMLALPGALLLPRVSAAQTVAQGPEAPPARVASQTVSFVETLQRAREEVPSVLTAIARARAAEAQIDTARAAYYPTLTLSSSPRMSFSDSPFLPATATTQALRLQNFALAADVTAQARMTLYDFGRTAANVSAAERGRRASDEDIRTAALTAMTQAAQQYITVLNDREAVTNARAVVAQREAQLQIAEGLVRNGARPPIERIRAEVNLDAARLDLVSTEAREETDRATLAAAIGLDPVVTVDVAPLPEDAFAVDDDPARAAQLALAARPEFAAARARLEQAQAQRDASQAQRRPTLAATAQAGASYTEVVTGRGLGGLSENASAGLSLSWPVFDATARANIQVAERNVATAQATLDAQSLQVRAAAVQAALATRSSRAALAQAERLATLAAANLEQAEGRYRNGAGTLLEMVDAQAADQSARVSVVRARLSFALARLQLVSAVGGLERMASPR
ncbi:MAG: TolC family protein [Myxococcales bacterium]|nr:TolC family protein [Myxococcales bacterium]